MSNEEPFARVTIQVDVHLGLEPARSSPSIGYEESYEFLVIRDAERLAVEFFGNPAAGVLAEEADDFDPDDLLVSAVKSALVPSVLLAGLRRQGLGD